jgi:hypothetical protein
MLDSYWYCKPMMNRYLTHKLSSSFR